MASDYALAMALQERVSRPLDLVLHDYSGHPFQVQLGRELARRGHRVLHLHCPSYVSGKGALAPEPDDPDTFSVEGVSLERPFEKYSAPRRLLQEVEYARRLGRRIRARRPDLVISGNTPLFAQRIVLSQCRRLAIPFVFWQQDLYSVAMKREAERRLPLAGRLVGERFVVLERRMLRQSDAVVTIAEDFRSTLLEWGVPPAKIHVIENWAPLAELPERPRDNEWAREHDLVGKPVLLYSGTLGLKHDPGLLLRLASELGDVRVVVVSEGAGAEWLRRRAPNNLLVLGFQPYERLPDVLASGDVLVAILGPEAGRFSVPSKVLSYHCAGRAIVAAVPPENLAARIVERNGTGVLVDPADGTALVAAASRLLGDPELRAELGRRARAYAEATFDIGTIGDRFEAVISAVTRPLQVHSAPTGGVRA